MVRKNGKVPDPEPAPVSVATPEDLDDVLLGADDERTEMDKVLEIVTDPSKIGYFTQMTQNELTAFSALGAIARKYPALTMLRIFLAQNLEYRVSLGRKGRAELVQIVGRQLTHSEDKQGGGSMWQRMVGRGR